MNGNNQHDSDNPIDSLRITVSGASADLHALREICARAAMGEEAAFIIPESLLRDKPHLVTVLESVGAVRTIVNDCREPLRTVQNSVNSEESSAEDYDALMKRIYRRFSERAERYETPQEELNATHEELQALNEELRLTAEELKASQEEQEILNEELQVVNQELKTKIEELAAANNDLQNLIGSTNVGTIFLNRSLRIQLFTPSAQNVFNLIPTDVGRSLSDITHKIVDCDLLADVRRVVSDSQIIEREVQSSTDQWYQLRISPYRTTRNEIEGTMLTFVDITTRKRAEEILRESETRFRALIERSAEAITVSERDGTIRFASPSIEVVSGYTPEEFAGRDPFAAGDFHSDEAEKCRGAFRELLDNPGRTIAMQHRYRHKSGEWRWLEGSFTSLFHDPAVAGLVANFRDITGRKTAEEALRESEARYRAIVNQTTVAVAEYDLAGNHTLVNNRMCEMLGYTAEELLALNRFDITYPEDLPVCLEIFESAAGTGKAFVHEKRFVHKNGTIIWVNDSVSGVKDAAGNSVNVVAVAIDITERKYAEAALIRARETLEEKVLDRTIELAQANEILQFEVHERKQSEEARVHLLQKLVTTQEDERKRIARDLHDQLGQGLTALRLKIEVLKQRCDGNAELCEQVVQTQNIAAKLDDEVSFLAWELRPAVLDDLGLIAALSNCVREWSNHYNIPAEFHYTDLETERLLPEIETSLYRIYQEAMNNVAKHARANRVDIILERRDESVILIIEDNGVGFEPGEKTNARDGLGLIGMRERAAIVGGTLEIESEPGGNTTIYAKVPARLIAAGESTDGQAATITAHLPRRRPRDSARRH